MDSARPRLLVAVHSAKRGGAQLVALAQLEALARDYELVIAIGHGPLRPAFAELGELVRGPTVLPVWGAPAPRWALQSARVLPDALRLAALARRHRAAAVLTNSSILVSPVLAARLAGMPVLVQVQEGPALHGTRALLRLHAALADTVMAISPSIAREVAHPRARVVVKPVGIALAPDAPARPGRAAGGPVRLLMVAGVDHNKGHDVAVRALAELVAGGADATLELVGPEADPAFAATVRSLAGELGVAERLEWTGPRSDVAARMLAADALLVASRSEVTPLVLMEALALRTPVVATRVGGIPDVVLDGRTGLLVAPDDPPAMAGAVRRLLDEPGLAAELARAGREHVEANFDERQAHERLHAEVGRLLRTAAPAPARADAGVVSA